MVGGYIIVYLENICIIFKDELVGWGFIGIVVREGRLVICFNIS